MKSDQIIMCCMTNISDMFLAQSGESKLVPGSFMIILK